LVLIVYFYWSQWRRNEFESRGGGTGPKQKWRDADPALSAGNIFWSCPSTFWL